MVRNPPANVGDARDVGSIPGWRISPGIGNGNSLQYSFLENSMDRGAWQATVHGVTKTRTWWACTHPNNSSKWSCLGILCFQLMKVKATQVVSNSLGPHGLYGPWNSPGQNTEVGSLSLLQGIFPTQGSNPVLPNCRQILFQLSYNGSPFKVIVKPNFRSPLFTSLELYILKMNAPKSNLLKTLIRVFQVES